VVLKPTGGRSSNGAFPFFNLRYGDEGLITGHRLVRSVGSDARTLQHRPTSLRGGLEKLALRLHPGEKFRLPRILMMPWKGEVLAAHNRFRRLLLFEYARGKTVTRSGCPSPCSASNRYVRSQPDWGTEAAQIRAANAAADLGCDTIGWTLLGSKAVSQTAWATGSVPPPVFPNGLKPISEACHRRGLKFVVWFEPERAAAGTEVAREHPDFVFGGEKGGLFKLDDPAARRWMADLLSRPPRGIWRRHLPQRFQHGSLISWRQADSPERLGLTEIRYVEGYYDLWDELLARHRGLTIDNCSSGGRRIDLENPASVRPALA